MTFEIRKIEINHLSILIKSSFDVFTERLEKLLGRFDQEVYKKVVSDPAGAKEQLEKMTGEEGLMLFEIQDHGALLNLFGSPKKGRQYVIGNPLIAVQMTKHDLRAGLYAPLRVFIYENDDKTVLIEYDLPSSLFGQFRNREVTEVAKTLDQKLDRLIRKAES